MQIKCLLYTEKNSDDPNIIRFQQNYFYRDYEVVAILTENDEFTGGGGINSIALNEVPNLFLKLFPIVLLDVENIYKTADKFLKLDVPMKNLIAWHPNGNTQPLVNEELGYKIVNLEGLEFHCKTDKDLKDVQTIFEQYKIMKVYYTIPPAAYKEVISQFLFNSTGIKMNWENPQTLQEKIQWLKLYDSTPLKTICADKFKVREYVAKKIGVEYLVPLFEVYDNPDDIDLNALPNQFVLKCNHGCGFNIIVRDKSKLDFEVAKEKLKGWLKIDHGMFAFEFQYCRIQRKIVAEKFIEVKNFKDIPDYKIGCFNGKAKFVQYLSNRSVELTLDYFDLDWNHVNLSRTDHKNHDHPEIIAKPKNLKLMIELAEKLSADFAFVRVDFYEVDGQIYFGELTFTPAGGIFLYQPSEYNKIAGDMLQLPEPSKPFNRFE